MYKSVATLVKEAEQNDLHGLTTYSKYVTGNMREDINTTEAYLNSKHISGSTDYLGREKPFFNIVTAIRNVWYRATDIDVKDIHLLHENPVKALIANILFQKWAKKINLSKFLNDWGLILASHGSAITEFIEKEGTLYCSVLPWTNTIVDPVDFENNLKIKILWLTPAQLRRNKSYNKDLVKKVLDNLANRKTNEGQSKDSKSDYIKVYEVHGELSMAQFKAAKGEEYTEEDEDNYFNQIHVLTFQSKKDGTEEEEGYTLYVGREAKSPHKLTHLIEKDGQTYAGGAVKNSFEAQWMVNDTQKNIKDHLELASKQIYQSSDGAFAGQNALVNIEQGSILTHKINEPITRIQNTADIAGLQAFKADWQSVANTINGVSEAMLGAAPKSGTAWRQTQALLAENHSLFELMSENKGIALKEIIMDYVLPSFRKSIKNKDKIKAILDELLIKQIDALYFPNEVNRRMNKKKKDTILSGQIYDTENEQQDLANTQLEVQSELSSNQRSIELDDVDAKTWDEFIDGLEEEIEIDVTGETKDIQGALATLSTVLQSIAQNPAVLQDENFRMVFNKILNLSGTVSPLEIKASKAAAQQMPQMPQLAQPVSQ